MTTPQPAALPELPPLPESNHVINIFDGSGILGMGQVDAYTADQMRAYALAALQSQPAAVSDDDIYTLWVKHCETTGTTTRQLVCGFARAILALRPQAVPMTEWQPMSTAPSSKTVLLAYKNEYRRVITVKACYYPKHTEEASEEDAALDYDEATDTYYVAAGWYEDNSESEINYGITGEFLGWLPVPVFAHHGITAQGAQGGEADHG